MPESVSNKDIYRSVEAVRLELKADINSSVSTLSINQGRLEKKFDDLEAGRLTLLETGLATLKARLAVQEEHEQDKENSISKWQNWIIPAILYITGQIIVVFLLKR